MVVINPARGPGVWPHQPAPDSLIGTATDPATKMVSRATLICRPNSHPFQDRHLTLEKPEKIGRSVARSRAATNNAIFDCKVLSRNHALLWFENGKFFLQDTKSSNGTFVNSQRLGKGTDESPPRELCSGDIVQFGVDVMENSKKVSVTHGCIVATLKLYLPDGKEAKASTASIPLSPANPIQSQELYQLQQCVQEAVHRERAVENKLATLQRLLDGVQTATNSSWKALIDEDRLLTRLEILEGQHALYSKNFGEDKLREEIARLQEEKNVYQNVAKESLKKVLQEKLEAVRKLQELERTVSSAQDECRRQTDLRDAAGRELTELAAKYEAKQSAVAELETKVKELEEEALAAEMRWDVERAGAEARAAQQRIEEAQQRARLEVLQAESDFTKQQLTALRQKMQNKPALDTTPNGDISLGDKELSPTSTPGSPALGSGMEQTECELAAVRGQLEAAESQLAAAHHTITRLREEAARAEAETAAFKESAAALEAELAAARTEAATRRDEAQRLETSLKEKQGELAKLEKQRSAGDADIKETQTDIIQLKNKVDSLQERLWMMGTHVEHYISTITILKELLEEARTARADSEAKVERCQSELLVTRNNGQEATLRADHLRTQLKETEASLTVRSERTEQLQQTVVRLAASVTEAVGQLQSLQNKYDHQQQAAADGRARADLLQESLTSAERRATDSSAEAESLRAQLAELRTELTTVRAETERRHRQLEETADRLQQLEQRFKACEEERDTALARCATLETTAAELSASSAPGGDAPDSTVSAPPVCASPPSAAAPPAAEEAPAAASASAEDDAEKAELRRQLQHMDEQLKELAVQNRTMDTSNVIAVAVLVIALFIALVVLNS
ncbi:sarcolemmal membrane-associated protein-like isoform X3 [Amphibalanus amphitrite]|uniref:sarcolemmal membrane-associated protein-like isoform X3 n=1 Tax=Amphibalanus amphitrite TaxID=1232801 RepID=UPI001C90EE83|nr:sarcolemmal membrane-associated protein-like isoform X3 [Amphibalanus amphitrite]